LPGKKKNPTSRKRDKILVNSLLVESLENLRRLNINKTKIQEKNRVSLISIKDSKVESIVNLIAETQEVNSIKLVAIHFKNKTLY
jgi:hypothetical protein